MKKNLCSCFGIVVLALSLYFPSCKKKDKELDPMRQFMPTGDITARSGETTATLSWKEAINADTASTSYTVIVSTDSLFTDGPQFTFITDTAGITLYDTQLVVRTDYYARVKTNGTTADLDSRWLASGAFRMTGEQIFNTISDVDLKHNSVVLRWRPTPDVVRIELTPAGGGMQTIALTQQDVDSSFKLVEGLTPLTTYHAEIFSDTKQKGFIDFTTKETPIYAFVLTPDADLVTVLDTCSPGIIIGLDPGTYESANTINNLTVRSKIVTLVSTSNNPADTKVFFKELTLKGDGAGINLKGITFDGSAATALYFLNLAGLASDGADAQFSGISVDNCIIRNYGNCFMRANRATNTNGHKIGAILVNNCIVQDNTMANNYTEFQLTKLQFESLSVTNSTWFNGGQAILEMTTTLNAGTPVPAVTFDHVTINNIGFNARRLFDANANPVQLKITNCIIANTPRTGALSGEYFRATGAGTSVNYSYNNTFKLTNGTTDLSIPSSTAALTSQTGNTQVDLGWNASTTSFTLPAGSPVRTSGSDGGAIGDPRWQ